MKQVSTSPSTDLVLVGGGHSHVQVLEAFAMKPPPDTRITLVVDRPVAMYSGMVPGFVAGQYRQEELEIDVLPLARRVGARVVMACAVRIDSKNRRIVLEGRPSLPFDVASINVGSTVAGLATPGVREHAIPTRPIGRFVSHLDTLFARLTESETDEPIRVLVVGAGAGGVEVAFALDHRLREQGRSVAVSLIESGGEILPGYSAGMRRRALEAAKEREIEVRTSRRVTRVESRSAFLEGEGEGSEQRIGFDLLLWVTGAVSSPLFRDSELPTDGRGFVRVRSTLQVEGHDHLFAVGDCATLAEHPETPKAGVYAVRQGPVLTRNLHRVLAGRSLLEAYRPQHDFLTLINTGDGSAIGGKWFFSFEGEWVFKLKDHIDRKFMVRFQPLDHPDERSAFDLEAMAPTTSAGESAAEMLCGGCAAKLGQESLERALERLAPAPRDPSVELGLAEADDAASYSIGAGPSVVASVDQFSAFTDDPYLVGRVGAINAASDVYSKGARPRWAQALVALPEIEPPPRREEILFQVMAGARAALDELDITLVGGHTTAAAALLVGFHVEGVLEDGAELLAHRRLEPEQALVLTKPLGTGVLFRADMRGELRGPWFEQAVASMLASNGEAVEIARRHGARAATDVTGFGLAGHLAAMLRAASVAAELDVEAIPALPGALEILATGLRSTFHEENERMARGMKITSAARQSERFPLLFDPQTSGGLLFGVPPARASETVTALHECGHTGAAVIGMTLEMGDGARLTVRRS